MPYGCLGTNGRELRSSDEFTRRSLDGKKAQNRFLLLLRQHKQKTDESARLSGVDEEESPKSQLLDDLTSLFNDSISKKSGNFLSSSAMTRGRVNSAGESSDNDAPVTAGKRKMILDIQEMEVSLEKEKLAFKKLKFEREMEEKEKDRAEREMERAERQQIREMENRRNEEMMTIIRYLLNKS
ncbi:hypothetical protein AC1031_000945 [Aphanomyces cochlioides]|nr:hypothetical protein AC1031_000945 [Aphanomyces cochlioides]